MRTISIFLCLAVSYCVSAQTSVSELNRKIDSIYKTSKIAGFGVSIMTPDQILYQNGFGYADIEANKKYTINTVQNIGSVSKTFIGIALMKAIEQGKLSVDTPINDILPFKIHHPKYPEISITVEHLATHTSSILDTDAYEKSYVIENAVALNKESYTKKERKELELMSSNKTYSLESFLKNHLTPEGEWYEKSNFLKHQPGDRYEYSNIASALLAYIIEIATDMSFPEYTQKHILDPLGMNNSGWLDESIYQGHRASTYTESGNIIPKYKLITYPDGGFKSSIKELSMYLQGLMRGYYGEDNILKAAAFQQMMSAKLTKAQYNTKKELKDNYGYFWEVSPSGKMGHNGSDPGILTLMYFNKKEKVGAIFFMNTSLEESKEIIRSVQQIWNTVKEFKKDYINTLSIGE
ncbi:class A beta-lactamase-related serine hydrolase [Aquimarina sp. AD1]|uniref:serine hydrolase domain-containing protein n=1 Tax=Aquimarina sp. (strain AD1) TaxID=1714848 RepID=UPI000E4868DA|nr:serine hydrolase domain-containing protein [Aquimarina sp. AD1]AXT55547.1 class A beta-lactamase-related serine hydrolase [Aquimarina sp. AD1]RKN20370.1 class A beta-lactamase-related serine hydrolase [Aquimarina sp. AD1]